MTKKTKTPKRALCALLAVVMLMGASFAYFSDYATTSVTGTAGTVAIAMDSDINLLDAEGRDILNPGDMRDGSFGITNEGNKSIDVRSTIALTALDHEGNPLAFTGSETEQSEFDLYAAADVVYVEGEGYKPVAGAQPLEVKSIDGNVITYVLPEYSLNGNSDKYAEVETIDGVDAFSADNDFVLVFKGESGNEWQAATIQLDVVVEAKQHENTQAGWEIVATEQITHGSITKEVVMGENIITADDVVEDEMPDNGLSQFTILHALYDGEEELMTFDVEDGMTWERWLDSEYNTHGFSYQKLGEYVVACDCEGGTPLFVDLLGEPAMLVDVSDVISVDKDYIACYTDEYFFENDNDVITFTMTGREEDVVCYALDGMTWSDWVDSAYGDFYYDVYGDKYPGWSFDTGNAAGELKNVGMSGGYNFRLADTQADGVIVSGATYEWVQI